MATLKLSESQLRVVLWAISHMTDGNARDVTEMEKCGMTRGECMSLISAEGVLERALKRSLDREAA